MRWSIAKAVTIGLVLLSKIAVAQPTAEHSLILSTQSGRFHLVLGRIKLDRFHYKKVRLHQASDESSEDEEFVCVTASQGTPSLHYLRQLGTSRITIDAMDCDTVRIESKLRPPSGIQQSLLIQQPSLGPIQITQIVGSHTRSIQSASYWHLLAEEPTLFEQQIRPLLGLMIDRCQLEQAAVAIEQQLRGRAARTPVITQEFVDRMIVQLGSPARRDRLVGYRKLATAGVGILPLLKQVDYDQLDAEQKQQIRKLKRHLSVDRSDTPDRVAAWLATDRAYWASVSRNWLPHQQAQANRFMLATCGEGLRREIPAIAAVPGNGMR